MTSGVGNIATSPSVAPESALAATITVEPERAVAGLGTTRQGLSAEAAAARLDRFGPNQLAGSRSRSLPV